ncbi:hypothetical protein DYB36_011301, partial [Aphanomyces astaci]
MEVDARIWIEDDEAIWLSGVIEECLDGDFVRARLDDGSVITRGVVDGKLEQIIHLRNDQDDFTTVPDLISLQYLHEPELLYAVCDRYAHDLIYTYIGEILLSFNPFQRLDMYSHKYFQTYAASSAQDMSLPPHVFAIAANAFKSLCDDKMNQSILVSGESGAGKTENTKFLMQYLTQVGAMGVPSSSPAKPSVVKRGGGRGKKPTAVHAPPGQIQTQILQTNPILEAFGNARTVRNDNSSRFGKFIELQFGRHHTIVGAKLSVYLLEKIRVSHQSDNERNFHIFYELCAGADDDLAAHLSLLDAEDFVLLNESGCFTRRDGVDDAAQFHETSQAFTDMGILADEQRSIYGIVAALLHLGNVALDGETCGASNMEHASIRPDSLHHLDTAAALLGVSSVELTCALVTRHVTTTKDKIMVKLSSGQATEAKQSLTQSLFGGLFEWIVARLSSVIRHDAESANSIGILDIFGFENLVMNGFEQLCINYANERLQAQFNDLVFAKEQRMYQAEGIEWKYIDYPDNAPCLRLLEDKPTGIWSLLDEEGMLPKGSNEGWIAKLYSQYLDTILHPSFDGDHAASTSVKSRRRQSEPVPPKGCLQLDKSSDRPFQATNHQRVEYQFVISHFAGNVMYDKDMYLEKNQDTMPAEAVELCGASTNAIVQALLSKKPPVAAQRLTRQPSNLRSASVSSQFKAQLDELIVVIGRTQARFIRCIKSNDAGVPTVLDAPRVLQQLRSGGVLEAVRIARAGYAVRVDHAKFLDAFGFFLRLQRLPSQLKKTPTTASLSSGVGPHKAAKSQDLKPLVEWTAAAVLVQFHRASWSSSGTISDDVVAVAKKVVEQGKVGDRPAFLASCGAVGFQIGQTKVFFRKDVYNDLRRFRLVTRHRYITTIQQHIRGHLARQQAARMKEAVRCLQMWMRERLAHRARRRRGAAVLQSWARQILAVTQYKKAVAGIPRIQKWWRHRRWTRLFHQRILDAAKEAKSMARHSLPPVQVPSPAQSSQQVVHEVVVEAPAPCPLPPATAAAAPIKVMPPDASCRPDEVPPRREVDSLMVSLSVENAQLKQQVQQLQIQQQHQPSVAAPVAADPSVEFAMVHIRALASQLVELQLQCAMIQSSVDSSCPSGANLVLPSPEAMESPVVALDLALPPPPTSLTEAHGQLQSLVAKIQVASFTLDQLERQKQRQLKLQAQEAQARAVVQTLTPVVATVRHVASYVPVVSYVVSQVETKVHVSQQSWCVLIQ